MVKMVGWAYERTELEFKTYFYNVICIVNKCKKIKNKNLNISFYLEIFVKVLFMLQRA